MKAFTRIIPFIKKRRLSPRILISALIACVLALTLSSRALADDYPKKIHFQNLMQNQDMALGEVEAIKQDHEGFLWLGGRNALLRYDGNEFLSVQIATDLDDLSKSLPVTQVVDIFEDRRLDMWVATRVGLFKYDRAREVLLRLTSSNGEPLAVFNDNVNRIAESPNGEIVLAGFHGLTILNPLTLNAVVLMHKEGDESSLPSNKINDIFFDANAVAWLGTDRGLVQLDWRTKKITHRLPAPLHPTSLPANGINSLAQDKQGDVWMAADIGLYRFNKATSTFTLYQHKDKDPTSLSDLMVREVYVDRDGWLWIATNAGGVNLYNRDKNSFIRFVHSEAEAGSISSDITRRIYQDKTGDLWIGTYPSGVNYYDRSTDALDRLKKGSDDQHGLLDSNIGAILEDKEGMIWIAAGAVTRYDPINETFTHYHYSPDDDSKLKTNSLISGAIDSDGDIWFGSWANSYQHYNREKNRFDQMPFDANLALSGLKTSDKLIDSVVWSTYLDSRKNLWIGTHYAGLCKYDKTTGIYTNYSPNNADPSAITSAVVWTSFEDSKHRFWVGTANGLNLMDRDKGTFKHYMANLDNPHALANASVLTIYEDKKGRLWFGTDAGLHLYREATDDFQVFNTKAGFVDHGIRTIIEDEHGNLWLGTNNGIVMFNPDLKIVRNYTRYNGEKIGGIATGAGLATSTGKLMFGTKNGIYSFDTKKIHINTQVPPVAITDFRLFTKKVSVDDASNVLDKVINQSDTLVLDYKKTMIGFSFAALNFRDPYKNQYAYKLEGFDDTWREVGNQRTALYTNLDAGTYVFHVRASNNDGIWNEAGKKITLIQLPPPWKAWWAYGVYGLVVILLLFQFARLQRNKRRLVEEQNRLLEIKVTERTAQLREKNNDIQAMLENMHQGLFTIQAGGTIHPEYSHYLEDIFETKNIAGKKALHFLFDAALLGKNDIDQIRAAIGSVIGEHHLNFDFNAHLLVKDFEAEFGGKRKFLALDWNPIIENELVIKLMVSVRDVTLLRAMEKEAEIKTRELDIISQLLSVPGKKYRAFVASTQAFLDENRHYLESDGFARDEVVALLFRNMHTIKGNCRTYGFHLLSDAAHEAESVYSDLKLNSLAAWNSAPLLDDLEKFQLLLNEYERIYYAVLGRGNAESLQDSTGFFADQHFIHVLQTSIEKVQRAYPRLRETRELQPVQTALQLALSLSLKEVLADVIASLPAIAQQLQKEPPVIVFEHNSVRIPTHSAELLANTFSHLLRNAIDHGIELPSVREQHAKRAWGTITIGTRTENNNLYLVMSDDGQGLPLSHLFQKGVDMGRWSSDASPTYQDIADFIFASGVSTKEQITDISGRGVGMDAVKQFLVERGGDIQVRLHRHDPSGDATSRPQRMPFELVIRLPESAYFLLDAEK